MPGYDLLSADEITNRGWPVLMLRPPLASPAAPLEPAADPDPLVRCGCGRFQIRASLANRGEVCTDCRRPRGRGMD